MVSNMFLWGTEPRNQGIQVSLWGTQPQYLFGSTANDILGHSFGVVLPPVSIQTTGSCGHRFTVPSRPVLINDISTERETLLANTTVQYVEPAQVRTVIEPQVTELSTEISEKQRIEIAIENFQQFIKAAEEMQKVVGERLKNRTVRVDPKTNPDVREAIRRLFGINSDEITYDMFKKCLELRSALLAAGRKKYGTGN